MLPPRLRKFSTLYESYGLRVVKNIWLLVCLLPLARTVNLYKMKVMSFSRATIASGSRRSGRALYTAKIANSIF